MSWRLKRLIRPFPLHQTGPITCRSESRLATTWNCTVEEMSAPNLNGWEESNLLNHSKTAYLDKEVTCKVCLCYFSLQSTSRDGTWILFCQHLSFQKGLWVLQSKQRRLLSCLILFSTVTYQFASRCCICAEKQMPKQSLWSPGDNAACWRNTGHQR